MKCPGSMAIPACRLATWSKGHFVDRRALYKMDHVDPTQGMARMIFWLGNTFRATAACNFWFLIRSDASAPAAFASLLFDPPETQNIGKNTVFLDFFLLPSLIFLLMTSSLLKPSLLWLFPPLLFHLVHLSTLSDVWLLNFLRWSIIVYYV